MKQISDIGPLLPPWGLFSTFQLLDGLAIWRAGVLFLREWLPHSLEHFAAMPVGKTEMGFIDNHCKDVGILDIPGRRDCRIASPDDEGRIASSL